MNITLYRIPGINKTDTPVFDTFANQNIFFAAQSKDVITTGFYPPYFKNTIKLDISEYALVNDRWNYCSLYYTEGSYSKIYYYFITNKRYINEDIIEIDIEMDTIQTFMFVANWIGSKVKRLTIPRWNSNTVINRDYIRENISDNSFTKLYSYSEVNTSSGDLLNWIYVAKVIAEKPTGSQTVDNPVATPIQFGDDSSTYFRSTYSFAFVTAQNTTISGTSDIIDTEYFMKNETTNNYIVGLYLIPFHAVSGIYVPSSGVASVDTNYYEFEGNPFILNALYNDRYIKININSTQFSFSNDIIKPISQFAIGDTFEAIRCAALLDNNYIKLQFGDPEVYTEFPLFELTNTNIYGSYWADITNGYRYYNMFKTQGDYRNNTYKTIACNPSALELDLKNNPWKTYLANNKATLGGALINTTLSGGISAATGAIMKGAVGASIGALSGVAGIAKTGVNYLVNAINLQHAPDTIRTDGSASSVISSGNAVISWRVYKCDDFDNCARYFEMFGNRFEKYTPNALFGLNNRHLYDYVKTEYVNVELGDRFIKEDFEDRFNNGLRLWHTTNGELNCKLDGYNTNMGDCLQYDNIEEWKFVELQG